MKSMYTGLIVGLATCLLLAGALFCSGNACYSNISRAVSHIGVEGALFTQKLEENAMESLSLFSSNRIPQGIVGIRGDRVTGWSLDPDRRNNKIEVHFYIDGKVGARYFAGSTVANNMRANLDENDVRQGHWYTFSIPEKYQDGEPHTLYAYGMDATAAGIKNARLLVNSPVSFTLGQTVEEVEGDEVDDTVEDVEETEDDTDTSEDVDDESVDEEEGIDIEDDEPKQLKIMSYNVRQIPCVSLSFFGFNYKQCDTKQWEDSRHDRRRQLGRFLRTQFDEGVDVVVLQELFWGKFSDVLAVKSIEQLAVKHFPYIEFGPSYRLTNEISVIWGEGHGVVSSGLVLLSRYPIEEFRDVYFNAGCIGDGCYAARGAFYANIDVDGTNVDIFNTHLEALEQGENVRTRQIPQLKNFIDTHKKSDAVFVVGDMNTFDTEVRKQSFSRLMGLGYLSGAEECGKDAGCELRGGQIDSYVNNQKLDYILFESSGTRVLDFEVLPATYKEDGETMQISDHKPIVGTFEID